MKYLNESEEGKERRARSTGRLTGGRESSSTGGGSGAIGGGYFIARNKCERAVPAGQQADASVIMTEEGESGMPSILVVEPGSLSASRRMSYKRGSTGVMQTSEFEKSVSIDATKLNEFLFKMHLRVESVEKEVTDYIRTKTEKAKEDKDALAHELEMLDHEEKVATEGGETGNTLTGGGGADESPSTRDPKREDGDDEEEEGESMARTTKAFAHTFRAPAMDDKMEALRVVIGDLGSAIDKLETDMKQRTKLQAAKDAAQDEILEMELKRLERQIEGKLSKAEILDANKMQDHKMKSLEAVIMGVINAKTQELNMKQSSELDRVLDQLNNIQQSADAQREIMEDRIKQAVTQGLAKRDANKHQEKKIQDDLMADVRDLIEKNAKLEEKHAEMEQELEKAKARIHALETAPPAVDVTELTAEVMVHVEDKLAASEDRVADLMVKESNEIKVEMEALEDRVRQQLHEKQAAMQDFVDDARDGLIHTVDHMRIDFDEYKRESRLEVERAFVQLQALAEQQASVKQPDITPLLAETVDELKNYVEDHNRSFLDRITILAGQLQDAEEKAAAKHRQQGDSVNGLREEVMTRLEDRKKELEVILASKSLEIEQMLQGNFKQLSGMIKSAAMDLFHKVEDSERATAEKRGALHKEMVEVRNGAKQIGLKLLRDDTSHSLGDDPPFADLVSTIHAQRIDDDYHVARLERSAIGLAELYRQLHGVVRGLATRDNHMAQLDARLHEHLGGMVNKCLDVQGEASSSKPFSLGREPREYISTNSYRIAKVIAYKADYDVIKRIISQRDATMEEDWDSAVSGLRERILSKFISDIVAGSHRAYPAHEVPLLEARARFCEKVERAIKLALSKFARINVAHTLFGKIHINTTPACMACDRPFSTDAGPGDRRAVCQDYLPCGSRQEKPSTAQSRTRDPAIPDDLGSLGSHATRRSVHSHASSLSSATNAAVPMSSNSSLASSRGSGPVLHHHYHSGGSSSNKKPVYRGGFKFPPSSGLALPLLYLEPGSSSRHSSGSGPSGRNSPSSSSSPSFPGRLIRVDEDYEVMGFKRHQGRPNTVIGAGSSLGTAATNNSNDGISVASSISTVAMPALER